MITQVWGLKGQIERLVFGLWRFLVTAWDLGVDDPRKVIHCLKVAISLTVVSLFYYIRPLNEGVGGSSMWAIMTVVVVFEPIVGQTLCKSLNRMCGTFLAAFLAVGVHWVVHLSGQKLQPLFTSAFVFISASVMTFSRFIPSVKARFDYGAMIFILTFSLVSISGYRVDKLVAMAYQRISTIIIGTCLCILVSMLICPIWASQELQLQITTNMEKLAISLEGCVEKYFNGNNEESDSKLQGYKWVLSSKATEESMANFSRWEPVHGGLSFRHPWKKYLKLGTSIRNCAYCIEALSITMKSENRASRFSMNDFSNICLRVSSNSSKVLKEMAGSIKTMKKSSTIDVLVTEMNAGVKELQNELTPPAKLDAMEIIPVVNFAFLLTEIAGRIEDIVSAVEEVAELAGFRPDKLKQNQDENNKKIPEEV